MKFITSERIRNRYPDIFEERFSTSEDRTATREVSGGVTPGDFLFV